MQDRRGFVAKHMVKSKVEIRVDDVDNTLVASSRSGGQKPKNDGVSSLAMVAEGLISGGQI